MKPPADVHPTIDLRFTTTEVRMTTSAAGKRTIEGYGAVFNSRSQTLYTEAGNPFVETIKPGAFAKSLTESDVRGLYNHNTDRLLGRRGAGTLRLAEDSTGLHYSIDLGNRSYDRDLEESLDRKDVIGSSFSFATVDDDWTEGDGGVFVRELRQVHLFDVGPVVFPAYRAATATCRSYEKFAEVRSAKNAPPPPAISYPTPDQRALLLFFEQSDF